MVEAYLLGKVAPNKESEALTELKAFKEIQSISLVYGKFDVIMRVTAQDLKELKDVVIEKIRKHPSIISTQTLVVAR